MVESKYVSGRDGTSRGSYTLITDAGAEIKTAYQAEANAFTDTKNTKLAGIDTGADVTGSNAPQSHSVASHSDITADGVAVDDAVSKKHVNTLDHSNATDHAQAHTAASHSDQGATGAELETLTNGSETVLHSHAGGAGASLTVAETEVFNATAPVSWTDLDLSGVIGANSAMVLLKVKQSGRSHLRRNGDANDPWSTNDLPQGTAGVQGNFLRVLVETDASGIVEWRAENAMTSTVDVVAYIK